jgi:rfaE bifunctional protein nucleotidyltransferase chain/domain
VYCRSYAEATEIVSQWKARDLTVVLATGSFDLLHVGHVSLLETARSYGGALLVAVDSDDKVKFRKGPTRPIVPEEQRASLLTHLRAVDAVVLKRISPVAWELTRQIQPDILVMKTSRYTTSDLSELRTYVKRVIAIDEYPGVSTSRLIARAVEGHSMPRP